MAGTVEEVGSGVKGFEIGDEVYGMVGGVGGLQGALAEFIAVDVDMLAHKAKTCPCGKKKIEEDLGASSIDYGSTSVEEYVNACTEGEGFDIVYDTVGDTTLDATFASGKRYTSHVLSCLGWGSHSLAPLSFRGATYSGVLTLLPLTTGEKRGHHGNILAHTASIAEPGKLKPSQRRAICSAKH
jgi:NADPH2:quinone reductase